MLSYVNYLRIVLLYILNLPGGSEYYRVAVNTKLTTWQPIEGLYSYNEKNIKWQVAVNYSYLTQREWSPSSFLLSFLKIRNKHTGRGSFANPLKNSLLVFYKLTTKQQKSLDWILNYLFLTWNNYVDNSKIWLLVLADFTSKNAESKSWCLRTKLTCDFHNM